MKRNIIIIIGLLIANIVIADKGTGESNTGFLTSLPPDAPVLKSPDNDTFSHPESVNVIWLSQIHTSSYTLQVSTSADFQYLILNETVTDTIFTLKDLSVNTTYYWRILAKNVAGDGIFSEVRRFTTSELSAVIRKTGSIPERYSLQPAYPNPFNPITRISYHLPENTEVSLVIYNSAGQAVQDLASGQRLAGEYNVTWDGREYNGSSAPSGLYICRFQTGSRVFTQKILLMH